MATMTLTLSDGQTWIYPAKSYTGYDGVKKTKNHWYKGHSVMSRRGKYCYQGGTSDSDGNHNGNMFSIFLFKDSSGRSLKNAVKAMGGSGKISKITLKMYVSSGWGGYFTPRICMTPYWDTSSLTGNSSDTYDGLGFKHIMTTGNLKKSAWHSIDLTSYKGNFDSYESLAFYCPGAYNARNSSYGAIHAQLESNPPQLIIEYNPNSAPNTPSVTVHTTKDSHGYITPALDFTVGSNGDPENNLHSSPYNYQLYNQNGHIIKEGNWSSSNRFSYDLSSYRGQTVKIRGIVRDSEGLTAYKDQNVYINSTPYWNGLSADQVKISFSSGLINSVFLDEVTMSWPKATDSQSQHSGNLRYSVYAQVETDKGSGADTSSNCVASNLTSTSLTINAAKMSNVPVKRGQRVYFSVWVSDGLEWSTYRLTSSWIYREQPPIGPGQITAPRDNYEDSITISWVPGSSPSGLTFYYYVQLFDGNDNLIERYDVTTNSFTCYDITRIPRGQTFYFKITTIDVNGSGSSPSVSKKYYRNSIPSKPLYLRVDADTLYFKDSIPLVWGHSTDPDGDLVKYNLYYSANNGSWKSLVSGTTSLSTTHNVKGFEPGTVFNYYVEAYDTFYVYSSNTYISAKPQINIPPEAPEISLPFSDRTLYTNVPRIIFRTDKVYNNEKLKVIITINGTTYTSTSNSSLFDKTKYNENETGVFTVPSNAPLNYSKANTIKIKVNDGIDDSPEKTYNFIVDGTLVNKIGTNEERVIKASELTAIKTMINATRFAYGLNETTWHTGADAGNKILKKFFEQASNSIHDVNTLINNKTSSNTSKRTYTKDSFETNASIKKTMFNKLIDIITKP